MKIDLFGAPGPEDHLDIEVDVEEVGIKYDVLSVDGPLKVICDLHRSSEFVRVAGIVQAEISMECARCLESYRQDIESEFSCVVRKLKQGENIPEISDDEEEKGGIDLIFLDHDRNTLDLTEFIHDVFLLAIPSKPVCDENCKGLCPVCGHNLNEGECGCGKKPGDLRWQSLSGLLNDNTGT